MYKRIRLTMLVDLAILLLWSFFILLLGYFGEFALGKWTGLAFTFAMFGIPCLYLLLRDPKNITKSLCGGIVIGVVLGFPFDFITTISGAWVINESVIAFPRFFFDVVHLDEIIWFFLWAVYIVAFYEHFVEHDKKWRISPRVIVALLFGSFATAFLVTVYFLNSSYLQIPFAYLLTGVWALTPVLLLKKGVLHKVTLPLFFFLPIYLGFDSVALANGWWYFPGQYVGGLYISGAFLPLEEIIVWIVLGSTAVLAYHEIFLDDNS